MLITVNPVNDVRLGLSLVGLRFFPLFFRSLAGLKTISGIDGSSAEQKSKIGPILRLTELRPRALCHLQQLTKSALRCSLLIIKEITVGYLSPKQYMHCLFIAFYFGLFRTVANLSFKLRTEQNHNFVSIFST